VEYIANAKRIKGESLNIIENVPKKEPETHFIAGTPRLFHARAVLRALGVLGGNMPPAFLTL
jgi:hypothetical protein